ncbi:hypothetical protein ES288_A13G008600v1 [Gossypium darwinii]|uniref:GIR1-like zinc ribbon domain-containing protein n=1 Tax=Gossypium darwinii TaxID=34276 RepID=A0A5D2DUX0_GOSDA|nr:hypothetical protein ES288_A13G008600v1 [Gossypium darwinii]
MASEISGITEITEISEIMQESSIDDVRSSNTSLISSANDTMKNCSNINQTANHNKEYRQGNYRKRSLTETGEEENGRNIYSNLELTPIGSPPKDCLSTNQCLDTSSTSPTATSRMLLNQQDSSGEEVEFNNTTPEEPSLVVMGCSRCFMYVMACEINPKCANCRTTDYLVDVIHDNPPKKPRNV